MQPENLRLGHNDYRGIAHRAKAQYGIRGVTPAQVQAIDEGREDGPPTVKGLLRAVREYWSGNAR